MQHTQWEPLYSQTDPNVCANFFNNIISHSYKKSFPLKFISSKRIKDKPWISTSLKKSITRKNHLFHIYTKNRTIENKQKYSKYRNILISCIRQSKKIYFQELFDRKSTRITKMWTVLGKMLNPNKKSQNSSIKEIISDGISYKEDSEVANALNSHFCNIGSIVSSKIQNAKFHFSSFLKTPQDNSFYLEMTNVNEVISEINKLKTKKAAGHDGIKPVIIKQSCHVLAKPLTHIYNASFETGVMPSIWKTAKVIPIFKNGERYDPNNYRPISLLSCFEKLLERLLAKRIISFLKKKRILYGLQFGFREGHSTIHALLELLDSIYQNLDDNNSCIGVFLDLSKAFDTIDHDILLKKLLHYGFRGKVHNWFASYLQNRKQYTCVNGIKSTQQQIYKGVPQGSVLGPILFTLYVNEMPNATSAKPRLFADDTCIFSFHANIAKLSLLINEELNMLHAWLKANKLLLNTSKTNFSIFVFSMASFFSRTNTSNLLDQRK